MTYTVTATRAAPTTAVTVDLNANIAGDNIVNIAEQAAGFPIAGTVQTGAAVSVTIGTATTTLDGSLNGTATRTLTVDMTAPTATYAPPPTLTVGTTITAITPGAPSADISAYTLQSGTLPPGLTLDATGGSISGTPTTATTSTALVTIRLTDTADNPTDVPLTFPAVTPGRQTLTGFTYSAPTAMLAQPAPTVTAPTGQQPGSALSYASSNPNICTVNAATGALTLVTSGTCVITVTASATTNYKQATATFTVTTMTAPSPAGVTVTPTVLTVPENGGTATYTVILNTPPTANVMITVTVAGAPVTAATVSPASLTFTTANWNTAQTVTVTGVNDSVDNPNNRRTVTVTHTAASADAGYNSVSVDSVTVTVTDDDTQPAVPPIDGSLTEERTEQVNAQILSRVFLSIVNGGNQVIADRLRAGRGGGAGSGRAAMSDAGGGISGVLSFKRRGDVDVPPPVSGVLSPGVLRQAGQWLSGDADELPWRDWVGGLAVATDSSRLGLPSGGALYANGHYTRLAGDGGGLDWDEALYGGYGGVDTWVRDDVLIGMSASYFRGEFDYTDEFVSDGEYDMDVGSIHPYIGWSWENLDVWASGGYGVGEVELNDADGRRNSSLEYGTLSLGASGRVYASDALLAGGRSELRLRSDGSAAWVAMDRNDEGFKDVRSRRVRVGLEASHTRRAMGYGNLRTGLEVGVRSDASDGQNGQGLEVGGSVEWRDAMPGLLVSSRGRVLTLGAYDEWGVSGALRLTPGDADGHGLSFNLSPSYGQENSGIDQLWQTGALGGVTPGVTSSAARSARMRMDSEVGYALLSPVGMVRPYLAASLLQGGGRTQRMGARWELSPGMKLNLEGARRERATTNDEHRIQLQWKWSW